LLAHWIEHVGSAATEQSNFGIKTYLVELFDLLLDDYHSHFFMQLPAICKRDIAVIIKASIFTFRDVLGYSVAEKSLLDRAYVVIRTIKRLLPPIEDGNTAPTDPPDQVALECALISAIDAVASLAPVIASPKASNKVISAHPTLCTTPQHPQARVH
jgi:hypothetical protein